MIKPSELRIGLCVRYPNSKPFKVTEEDMLNEDFWADISDNIEPIPLTPEILEKAGFEKDEDEAFSSTEMKTMIWRKEIAIAEREGEFHLWAEVEIDEWYSFQWTKIDYLHQLQNLYFALTGEELVINLPVPV